MESTGSEKSGSNVNQVLIPDGYYDLTIDLLRMQFDFEAGVQRLTTADALHW